MSREEFKLAVAAVITHRGKVLIGQKEDKEDRVISGQWHLPGGFVEKGESTEEAVKREVEEETGLKCEVHQVISIGSSKDVEIGPDDIHRVFYHLEADNRDAEAGDDLQDVKWVKPEELEQELDELDTQTLETDQRLKTFIEKLKKMPT